MAFKKHQPKFRHERETIRRKHCRFCDGFYNINDTPLVPEFGAYVKDHELPFKTDLHVSGTCGGEMAVTFTWPCKEFMHYAFRNEGLTRAIPSIEARMISRELIQPRRQRFFIKVQHCPMCGRKFKNNRSRDWSK